MSQRCYIAHPRKEWSRRPRGSLTQTCTAQICQNIVTRRSITKTCFGSRLLLLRTLSTKTSCRKLRCWESRSQVWPRKCGRGLHRCATRPPRLNHDTPVLVRPDQRPQLRQEQLRDRRVYTPLPTARLYLKHGRHGRDFCLSRNTRGICHKQTHSNPQILKQDARCLPNRLLQYSLYRHTNHTRVSRMALGVDLDFEGLGCLRIQSRWSQDVRAIQY